jgi:DNA polymerase III delta prime subunit
MDQKMSDSIRTAIDRGELPSEKTELLGPLIQASGAYTSQESTIWDFKREWPFSYSDVYFAGIARLICAFSNTHGGIIVFGVHDESRTPGHNKVTPALDRLQQALNQLLSDNPLLAIRRYDEGSPTAVDVLLVRRNADEILPIRFRWELGGYKAGVIWVRQGHEVIPAEPRHVSILYCRSSSLTGDTEEGVPAGGFPPSPATIKRFVGRLSTIDQVFSWLKLSDEPRTFLYGKGGSGKTTIAYEIAKVLKTSGARFRLNGEEALDNVIFVTAKQRTLNVFSQSSTPFVGLDFSTERELYESLLTLGNWTSKPLSEFTLDALKQELKDLFDLTSNFIVVDDIDTLTTKGLEAGFDFLYGVLWRSKRRSKILYTIRNAPSQSIANSIEVPGLEDGDYEEFVRVCSNQFKVQAPDPYFVSTKLSVVSERRPLVIESLIALRRTAGNYDRAVQLFEEGAGEDVRSYVFQREWNSLPADNHGRYILAVLALHGTPLAFEDIVALTRYEERRVRDGLADIREMFLQVNEVGHETTFQLGALTRAFVAEQSKRLDLYSTLKERVEKYRSSFYPENPLLSRLKEKVEALIGKGYRFSDGEATKEAYHEVMDPSLSPKISEDPRFISLQAYVCVSQTPARLDDARRLFGHVFAMKFEPEIEHLKRWFFVERHSGYGLDQCLKIADFVSNGKTYGDDDKIEFLSRKATALYNRGKNNIYYNPVEGLTDVTESLSLHLICYSRNFDAGSTSVDKSEEYGRNTAYFLFNFLLTNGRYDEFFLAATSLCENTASRIDPVEEPLFRAFQLLEIARGDRADINRIRSRLEQLRRSISNAKWYDQFAPQRLGNLATKTGQLLTQKSRPAK